MNISRLIFRNLQHYRKPYLAILAGVMLSTAVLTGALIVGDSVKFSLQRITLQRLGKIRIAILPGDRIFRQELAAEIGKRTNVAVEPILGIRGIAISNEKNTRINRVEVIGITSNFGNFWDLKTVEPGLNEAVLSLNTASRLGVSMGDEILLRIQPIAKASPNAPFVPDRSDPVALRLRIKSIAGDDSMGRFSLQSEQTAPLNVFVNLDQLAGRLDLKGMANGMLVADNEDRKITPSYLDSLVIHLWHPADAGLRIKPLGEDNQFEITSDRIFLTEEQSEAVFTVIPGVVPVLTYMVNSIEKGGNSTPYSFVTAADTELLHTQIGPREIIINRWLAEDLNAVPGDFVKLTYWVMGPMRSLHEKSAGFYVKSVIPLSEIPFGPRLMPDFPGMSDAGNCRDWETGSPVVLAKIRDKDEAYWTNYRGTPKAFIAMDSGQKLWANIFGQVTAFRFSVASENLPLLLSKLMGAMRPAQNGLVFRPVQDEGMLAAVNATEFGQLFLGLSFFIIAAALLLTALLFSLHIRRRMAEAGVLAAIGFRRTLITRILTAEAIVVVFFGSIAGSLAGIVINVLLLAGLNSLWYDAVQTTSLVSQIKPETLMIGAISGMVTAFVVMAVTLWRRLKMPVAMLVKGVPPVPAKTGLRRPRNLAAIALLSLGTFAIIVTGANRKNFSGESRRYSGTGGFLLWCETTLPVTKDLNTNEGKKALSLEDEPALKGVMYIPLQRLEGEDASCLNLNRVTTPPLLAVPAELLDSLSAFSFAGIGPETDPAHPWRVLMESDSGNVINAFADMTVITWGLQKKIGDTLRYKSENGDELLVKLAGGLESSVFQGNILIDNHNFSRFFPSVSGAKILLINGPEQGKDAIAARLEAQFRDYGMIAISSTDKLASFNAVENTYLSVFMMLGGLGMIIGTIGLGIIIWQNIQERKSEFALLRAIGFSKTSLLQRIITEYLIILASGIAVGSAGAIAVLAPGFFSPGFQFPVVWVSGMITAIFISGIAWIYFPAKVALNKDIISALRTE